MGLPVLDTGMICTAQNWQVPFASQTCMVTTTGVPTVRGVPGGMLCMTKSGPDGAQLLPEKLLVEKSGIFGGSLDWPYVEGLRLDEAMHPLTLMTVGMYGQVLPNQNGAPLRVVVPWKYGFKSGKSIVRIRVTADQPKTSWEKAASQEYGFYSNVNPDVSHPRWSQATERRIGEFRRRKTLMFNGYADQVGSLYAGLDLKKNY